MLKAIATLALFSAAFAACAAAQVPPRYEIVTIDDDPTFNYAAQMNNRGQVVYTVWFDEGNTDATDIFLYDNGNTIRLTDDDVFDRTPDINDDGTIVWSRAVDGPGSPTQIVMQQYPDGELTQLTCSALDNRGPRINNLGHVVWKRYMGSGCGGQRMDIFFYDGETTHRITTNGETDDLANQSMDINDHDEIIWAEYDFCQEPWWDSEIMHWADGITRQLSGPESNSPTGPKINNWGQIVWQTDLPGPQKGIILWDSGNTELLTNAGGAPRINDPADIAFHRWYEGDPIGSYEVWLYRRGEFLQITEDPHDQGWNNIWNLPTDINDLGEIVYTSGRPWYYETTIECMKLRLRSASCPAGLDGVDVAPLAP